jgi:hypothetical protein
MYCLLKIIISQTKECLRICLVLLSFLLFTQTNVLWSNASKTKSNINKQQQVDLLIRESYNEVSAHVISYFNDRCNLAVQNCLFQTQWERVFGKDKLNTNQENIRRKKRFTGHDILVQYDEKKSLETNSYSLQLNSMPASEISHKKNKKFSLVRRSISLSNFYYLNDSFYYCQAFLVARFCIDDYLKKSIDHIECLNNSDGNSPNDFKRSIYRNECKNFYTHFFGSLVNSSDAFARKDTNVLLYLLQIFLFALINFFIETQFLT